MLFSAMIALMIWVEDDVKKLLYNIGIVIGVFLLLTKQNQNVDEEDTLDIKCWLCKKEFDGSLSKTLVECDFCGIENYVPEKGTSPILGQYPPLDFKTRL